MVVEKKWNYWRHKQRKKLKLPVISQLEIAPSKILLCILWKQRLQSICYFKLAISSSLTLENQKIITYLMVVNSLRVMWAYYLGCAGSHQETWKQWISVTASEISRYGGETAETVSTLVCSLCQIFNFSMHI